MRRSAAAAAPLALVLLLAAAAADHSYCERLANESADRVTTFGWRSVSYLGRPVNVTLVWGSEPAHAAAALLAALLRHARLYRDVRLKPTPSPLNTAALAAAVPFSKHAHYNDLVVGVSTAWEPGPALSWEPHKGTAPGLAGPRLAEFGASAVPVRRRLFAWLSKSARGRPACRHDVRWLFYANVTALADCDFVDAVNSQGHELAVNVLCKDDCDVTLRRLQRRAEYSATPLRGQNQSRADFRIAQNSAHRSFLFLDYDLWQGDPNVSVVELPPCDFGDCHCTLELDSAIAMRVADVDILQAHAPSFLQYVHDFKPPAKHLRLILERQASGVDIEEAACQTTLEEYKYHYNKKYDLYKYTVLVYFCYKDPSHSFYADIVSSLGIFMNNQTEKFGCDIQYIGNYINCSDDYHTSRRLNDYTRTAAFHKLVGVVSMGVKGAAPASTAAAANHVPLVLADVVPDADAAAAATWRAAPCPRHLARALLHFVRESHWTRVAVLSQTTNLAQDYYDALKDGGEIVIRVFPVTPYVTEQEAQKVLQDLKDVNARIVFVNADSQAASTILTAAVTAPIPMGYADGYVWIVREWQQNDTYKCGTEHFTVSSWTRGVEDIPEWWRRNNETEALHIKLKEVARRRPWPPHASSLVDAILSLVSGYKDVFKQFPNMRQDLHTGQVIRSLKESLIKTPVRGVSQQLRFKERSIEEAFVFVDQWCGGKFTKRLARWRVNATSGTVSGAFEAHASYEWPAGLPRDDGASRCTVRSGDAFQPTCHDIECACGLLLLALAPAAVLLARRAMRRRLARLQQEQQIQLIARRRHVATVLAAYLVERAALELHEELGAGRFGSVRLARLREPARAPRYIAAKALRENAAPAEESEFLREACTIASLEHAHIVRLVGVCIADGPPLVLMELAFFGDLLGYLRARRHLVEGACSEAARGEAEHVSAAALTRLAREAAEALQYLGVRGVVHRDVRAANCLVDVRRSLKLADFGMARDTVAGADGAPEYSCRRRGLFPVLWMAPESLAHGVFSAASDVWALGVLVLELVTLGARPYGAMSPLRVLEYVATGGSPPLPLDATPQTRGLARLCWARAAERRPSAAEVAAYLAAWPHALHPALLSERDEPADADSGFGESPSTELLPPDSPLRSLDQFDDLVATH